METKQSATVVLNLPDRMGDIIRLARAVIAGLTGNHDLPSPNPSVATLTAQVDALDLAHTAATTRTRGSAADRNAKKALVVSSLKLERAYVQGVVDANPDRAEAIAQSAGMRLKAKGIRVKNDLTAKVGAIPGTANLVARSAGRGAS